MFSFIMIIFFALTESTPPPLHTRTITTTYTHFGAFDSFLVQWKPTRDVCASCLLQLQFPQPIHSGSTALKFSLWNQFGDSVVSNGLSLIPTSQTYYFAIPNGASSSVWYTLQIWPTLSPSMSYGLIGVAVVSQNIAQNIIYQSNPAFEYYHLQTVAVPPQNILIAPLTQANTQPGAAYAFQLNFSSTYITSQTTTLSLTFTNQQYSLLSASTPLIQNNNFNFFGTCRIICSSASCITQISCEVINNQIKLVLPSLSSLVYTVEFYVLNPNFVDSTGIAAEIYDPNGLIKGINIYNNLFSTTAITILPATVYLHWGIPWSVVNANMSLGLFVDGGWNSIDLGFTVDSVTTIGSQFTVRVYVGASFVLQHSINTNLPQLNATTSQRCSYSKPYITCTPIDSFTSTSLRYYIRFKAYFAASDAIANLGSFTITIPNSPNTLFLPLNQNLGITTIPYADYYDSTGFHNTLSHRIQQTMVIGAADNGLVNSTSTFMDSLLSSAGFVGVDPEMGNQQLVFLLKTALSQTSTGAANQSYQMKVFFNPHIFESISDRGIDVTAYSTVLSKYQNDAVSCHVDSSLNATIQIYQCQAYNDYVYNIQYDNTLKVNGYYGEYQFNCGNGLKVVCATASCAESCRIFKGQANTNGYSGVFSIRNVTFKQGYQSPYLAGDQVFDFIIAFYQGGVRVSAALINAYTLKSNRLQLMGSQYHNVYLSASQTNGGSRVPSLLGVDGILSIGEIAGYYFDKLMLFLPNQISVNGFIESSGRVGCSKNCSAFAYSVPIKYVGDNWLIKQAVAITSSGSLNLQSNIRFKLPVLITKTIIGSLELALFQNGQLVRIYRFNGSSVGQNFNLPASPTVSTNSGLSAWSNPDYWVRTASDIYKQGVNLNQITAFSAQNTIDMLGSVLTYSNGNPSCTFTSIYQSIFSDFSSAFSNGITACDTPFSYVYSLNYNVSVLWCPLMAYQTNQIVISYPYYSSNLGTGFPFSKMFSYAVEDNTGNLLGFRTQSNGKTTQSSCITALGNNYNYGEVTKQQLAISLTLLSPITLSPSSYKSFALIVALPSAIAVSFISCQINELLLGITFGCSLVNATANQASLVATYAGTSSVSVISLDVTVIVAAAAAASVSPTTTYYYSVNFVMPQSDSSALPAYYGTLFAPYSSTIAVCSSTLSLFSIAATGQSIILSGLQVRAIALNYICQLSFGFQLTHSRSALLAGQKLVITLSNVATTVESVCELMPNAFSFDQVVLAANTITYVTNRMIQGFSLVDYSISCRELILLSNNPSVSLSWLDGANILQQSSPLSITTTFAASGSVSGSVLSKQYNSLGYDSKYEISIARSTLLGDIIQLWLDFKQVYLNSLVVQCHYIASSTVQVYCVEDWSGKLHISFVAQTTSSMRLTVYGIRQYNMVTTPILMLLRINQVNYFSGSVSDAIAPNKVSGSPIVISSQSMQPAVGRYCAAIEFTLPVAYSATLYLTVDISFWMDYTTTLVCQINSINYPCNRLAPNLVQILSTAALSPPTLNTLKVCQLSVNTKDLIDQQLTFKLFTTSGQFVSMGSHDHGVSTLQLADLSNYPSSLQQWCYGRNVSWIYHVIYIGYYGKSVELSPIGLSRYSQNIFQNYSSINNLSYCNSSTDINMGSSSLSLDLAANTYYSAGLVDYLVFNTTSSIYYAAPKLPIYVSDAKCTVKSEYPAYTIYTSGITIPILLDFSACRPISTHILNYTLNSPYLSIDSSLSSSFLNATQYKVYVVVRQIPSFSFSGSFSLQTTLSGPFNASFSAIAAVTIQVSASSILQIPQSQLPAINYLNDSWVNVTVQCSQPSTIYWALALSPQILGVVAADIQAKLTIGSAGLVSPYIDSLSWADENYGFTYAVNANENKTISVGGLLGSSAYNFKYFCVNQMGYSSAGQVINFTTLASQYGLTKVTLSFSSKLTIYQSNRIACMIGEVLLTPYSTVTTSTFSNCYNASTTFYPAANTTYYDQIYDGYYDYFYYVDSTAITINQIVTRLPSLLYNYSAYVAELSPYSSMRVMSLTNNYQPTIYSSTFASTINSITVTADVGVTNSYLVVAYINQSFDITTMSLPTTYMMKMGNFSAIQRFNRVYMVYGSGKMSVSIDNLTEYKNYTVFYYATVDNPALTSRATQVFYQNVQTLTYVVYYLSSYYMMLPLLLASILTVF